MSCLKREVALPSAKGLAGLDFNAFDVMEPRTPAPTPRDAKTASKRWSPKALRKPTSSSRARHSAQ